MSNNTIITIGVQGPPGPEGPTGATGPQGPPGAGADFTYITTADETSNLPDSSQILAGSNITFDTSTPNQLTINASGGGSSPDAVFLGGPSSSLYVQAPTSGEMVDEYWFNGDWVSSGDITATRLRLHATGSITVRAEDTITCATELAGGSNFSYGATQLNNTVGWGQGLGGAVGAFASGNANGQNGGGGGGFGGQGGQAGNADSTMAVNVGGPTYHITHQFCGSGGAAGGCPSSGISEQPLIGGAGGGSLYFEAFNNITIGGDIIANGGNGQGEEVHGDLGPAGGGSGGALEFRCRNILTVSGNIHANGGNGGDGQGVLNPTNGGGGGGGYIRGRCASKNITGVVAALGGQPGAHDLSHAPAILATAGSAGIVDIIEVVYGPPIKP